MARLPVVTSVLSALSRKTQNNELRLVVCGPSFMATDESVTSTFGAVVCFFATRGRRRLTFRCGAGIQNWKPAQPRGGLPHHARVGQPLPSRQSPHLAPPVRASLQPRRGPGGTPRPSVEGGARSEEDQSGERVFAFGGALPGPGLRPRPVLHLHHCQRRQNVQVSRLCRAAAGLPGEQLQPDVLGHPGAAQYSAFGGQLRSTSASGANPVGRLLLSARSQV